MERTQEYLKFLSHFKQFHIQLLLQNYTLSQV